MYTLWHVWEFEPSLQLRTCSCGTRYFASLCVMSGVGFRATLTASVSDVFGRQPTAARAAQYQHTRGAHFNRQQRALALRATAGHTRIPPLAGERWRTAMGSSCCMLVTWMNPKSGVNVSHSDSSGRADASTFIADLPALASSSGAVYDCPNMTHLRLGIAATTVSLRRSASSKTGCLVTNSTQGLCVCCTHRKSTTGVRVETGRSLPVAVSVRAMGGMVRPLKSGAANDTSTGTSTGPATVQRHGLSVTGVSQAPAALARMKS